MSKILQGKTAIVTGATKGMGQQIALGFADNGANVIVVSRNLANCQKIAQDIESRGTKALAYEFDITHFSRFTELVQRVQQEFGSIDILVNNAGGFQVRKNLLDITEEDWEREVSLNLKPLFFISQTVAQVMMKQGKGKIVNISSMLSKVAVQYTGIYAMCKAGVSQLTRSMAQEWAQFNINVNAICPGWMETIADAGWVTNKEIYNSIVDKTPLNRTGKACDVVGAAVLLASDGGGFITGQEIVVDGGWTIV